MKNKFLSLCLMGIMIFFIVPLNVFATDAAMSEEFKSILNSNGELVFNYVQPSTIDDVYMISEDFSVSNSDFWMDCESFNDDFSECEIYMNYGQDDEEKHMVKVVYNYDEEVKKTADKFVAGFPVDREYFNVKDLEIINYWVNGAENDDSDINYLSNYSGELKEYLNYSNFIFTVDSRAGSDDPFVTIRAGIAKLIYDDVVYFSDGWLGAKAEHAIYVPETTGDTPEELISAAQKRIDDYIGEGKVKISLDSLTVENYYNSVISDYDNELAETQALLDAEMLKDPMDRDVFLVMECEWRLQSIPENKQYFMESFEEGGDNHFLTKGTGGYLFKVEIDGEEHRFIIIKNDDEIQTPTYKTVDLNTNVQISSSSSQIPLDTVILAERLTSGDEYDKIIELLKVTENETYDLKLFSETTNNFFSKLESGMFEVRIPLPDKFKDKELVAYYVDTDDKITTYEVKVEDEYVIFLTDHFSIYTLAEKPKSVHEHTLTYVAAKEATYTEEGNIAYWTCDCGKWYADAEGKKEITDKASVVIAKLIKNDELLNDSPQTGDSVDSKMYVVLLLMLGGCLLVSVAYMGKKREL
ncbi:MAG: hypothetical protein IJA34_12560 [Lachnospiraceae bacterium]|nr:hypothetical protein [Lachnospiraceae bacterium]